MVDTTLSLSCIVWVVREEKNISQKKERGKGFSAHGMRSGMSVPNACERRPRIQHRTDALTEAFSLHYRMSPKSSRYIFMVSF